MIKIIDFIKKHKLLIIIILTAVIAFFVISKFLGAVTGAGAWLFGIIKKNVKKDKIAEYEKQNEEYNRKIKDLENYTDRLSEENKISKENFNINKAEIDKKYNEKKDKKKLSDQEIIDFVRAL